MGAGAVSLESWRMWSNLARLPALSVRAVISKVPVDDHFSFTIWVSALTIAGLCRSGGGTADRRCGRSLTLQDIVLCVVESAVLIRCRRPWASADGGSRRGCDKFASTLRGGVGSHSTELTRTATGGAVPETGAAISLPCALRHRPEQRYVATPTELLT
jgi:hypothetical protein